MAWPDEVDADRSDQTWAHYRERIGAFLADFADRPLNSFTRDEAREWAQDHRAHLTAVRAMFSDAERHGLIPANPFTRLGLPREQIVKAGILTPEELAALALIAAGVHGPYGRVVYGPMLTVAGWAGLEPGELYGLRPCDVDLDRRCLTIRVTMQGRWPPAMKEAEPRQVALLEPAHEALRFVGVGDLPPDEPIFRTQQGKWVHQRLQAHYWHPVRDRFTEDLPASHWLPKRIKERGDKGRLMMSELRHLFGAQLAARGVSPSDVALMMGDRDGGKRAEGLYFQGRGGSPVERTLEAFKRTERAA